MPRSSTAKRHRDTTNTARIATYARSKRRRSSIQTRVPSSIFTARHTGRTTRKLAVESTLRNTEKIESLAGDKGYDDQSLRDALRSEGVRPLLRHRLFAAYDHAHNARLDSELYGQRWMAETAFSAIKRRFGPAVHPRAYREFRELVLTATVYNLEQALKQ